MFKLFMIFILKLILVILLLSIDRYIFQKGTIKLCCPSCKIKIKWRDMKPFNGPFGFRKPAPCPHCGTIIIPDRLSDTLSQVVYAWGNIVYNDGSFSLDFGDGRLIPGGGISEPTIVKATVCYNIVLDKRIIGRCD